MRSCTHSVRFSHSLLFNYVSTDSAWLFWELNVFELLVKSLFLFLDQSDCSAQWVLITVSPKLTLQHYTPRKNIRSISPVGQAEVWLIVKWQYCSVLQLNRTAFKELEVQEESTAKCKYPKEKVLIYRTKNNPLSVSFRVEPGDALIYNYA